MTADEVVNGLSIPDELARRPLRAQRKSAALNECSGTACAIRKPTSLRFTARRRGAARPRHHTAPAGRRKVVLATSIAETSLTIEGVRVVVDSGLARPALRARSWAHPARNRARLARRRFCGSAQSCGRSHHERRHETPDDHLLKSNRRQQCVRMPGKWPDQTLERHSGRLECREPAVPRIWASIQFKKSLPFTPVREPSGESLVKPIRDTGK